MHLINKIFKKKIKIYYICQFIQGYDKFASVVDIMKNDPNIDIKILAFPDDINDFPYNKELSFWQEKFGDIVINAISDDGWFNLYEQHPDYVFVQRPYNNYLPEEYSTDNMCRFTKLCYIPYGYALANLKEIVLNTSFLKNLYFFFADNKYEHAYAEEIMMKLPGAHYSKNLGYPNLDNKIRSLNTSSSAFKRIKSNIKLKVIYTPRWTTDEKLLTTSFFDYKDKLVDYFHKHSDMQLVFRPHPLAFPNFIKEKLMTKREVKEYLAHFDLENMVYDKDSEYFTTFQDSDVLLTDFSSLIIEYFILGKPIILLDNNKDKYSPLMLDVDKVCYHATTWREIEKILADLKKGKDPLKEKRAKLVASLFLLDPITSSQQIVNCIKEDFYGH